jgi:hypothetical protein
MDESKIAIAVLSDLPVWQKLNITAFLASGIAARNPTSIGAPYRDGSGREYYPMFGQPVVIFEGDSAALRRAYERAIDREVTMAIYTRDLFATFNDVDNRAAVAAVVSNELDLVGIGFRGPRKVVDKIADKLSMHR